MFENEKYLFVTLRRLLFQCSVRLIVCVKFNTVYKTKLKIVLRTSVFRQKLAFRQTTFRCLFLQTGYL